MDDLLQERNLKFWKRCHLNKKSCRIQRSFDRNLTVFLHFLSILWKRYHLGFIRIIRIKNKADKSASNSLNPSIFEGLVTLCAPDAVCFSRHIPHASGRILAERFLFDRKFIVISYQTKKLSPEYHKHHCHIAYDRSRTALYLQLSVQKRPHHYCCSWSPSATWTVMVITWPFTTSYI